MQYIEMIEMSIEEAERRCKKNTRVLVATRDLADNETDIVFVSKRGKDYSEIFEDVKTVASLCDDFANQLKLFTEKQDIKNIRPYGKERTVLLKE